MAEEQDRAAARERANSIRLKRFTFDQSSEESYQPMYVGGGVYENEQQEADLESEGQEDVQDIEQAVAELSNYSSETTLQTSEEQDFEKLKEIEKKRKTKRIQACAEQFLGLGAKLRPIGECPVCGEKSIYFSTKATDNLLGIGLLAATGNYMITYYCMNPKCSASWKSGKCRRKFNATAADAVKFDKKMSAEWKRVFRIER